MASVILQMVPLELLRAGEQGTVVEISGRNDFVVRLEEMGLHAGARICMIRPGSPCIVEINHHRISFRIDESATVLVDLGP